MRRSSLRTMQRTPAGKIRVEAVAGQGLRHRTRCLRQVYSSQSLSAVLQLAQSLRHDGQAIPHILSHEPFPCALSPLRLEC